jgi:hypothetical protein
MIPGWRAARLPWAILWCAFSALEEGNLKGLPKFTRRYATKNLKSASNTISYPLSLCGRADGADHTRCANGDQ